VALPKGILFFVNRRVGSQQEETFISLAGDRMSGKAPEFSHVPEAPACHLGSGSGSKPRRSSPRSGIATECRNHERLFISGQVSPIACQLGPGLGLTDPPPVIVLLLISQIVAWPLAF
jgi:hypothetical protein